MPRSLSPRLLSFDVFGTLISVRDGSYGAFRSILADAPGGNRVDVKEFFEYSSNMRRPSGKRKYSHTA